MTWSACPKRKFRWLFWLKWLTFPKSEAPYESRTERSLIIVIISFKKFHIFSRGKERKKKGKKWYARRDFFLSTIGGELHWKNEFMASTTQPETSCGETKSKMDLISSMFFFVFALLVLFLVVFLLLLCVLSFFSTMFWFLCTLSRTQWINRNRKKRLWLRNCECGRFWK